MVILLAVYVASIPTVVIYFICRHWAAHVSAKNSRWCHVDGFHLSIKGCIFTQFTRNCLYLQV